MSLYRHEPSTTRPEPPLMEMPVAMAAQMLVLRPTHQKVLSSMILAQELTPRQIMWIGAFRHMTVQTAAIAITPRPHHEEVVQGAARHTAAQPAATQASTPRPTRQEARIGAARRKVAEMLAAQAHAPPRRPARTGRAPRSASRCERTRQPIRRFQQRSCFRSGVRSPLLPLPSS
jgi:hypothetical protein